MKKISVIVPVYNEKENIKTLHAEIFQVCRKLKNSFEIIIINDGSNDGTSEILRSLSPAKIITFRKNFGQTAAIDAGIKNSGGDYIITMDGDGQNDPAAIPSLISHLETNNLDIVSGWRKKRKDSFFKKIISRTAHMMRRIIINDGIHDSGCTLKIYKKECFRNISLFGEMHRFIPALLKIRGFKIGEIHVNHRPRKSGRTKYTWTRAIKGFTDMISLWFWNKFAVRPLHLLGGMGLFAILMGIIASGAAVYLYILGNSLSDTALPLLAAFLLITGIQLFVSGLISDMMSKNYYENSAQSYYSIAEITVKK